MDFDEAARQRRRAHELGDMLGPGPLLTYDERRLLARILDPANSPCGHSWARLLDGYDRFDPTREEHWGAVAAALTVAAAREGDSFGYDRVTPVCAGAGEGVAPAGVQLSVWVPRLGAPVLGLVDEFQVAGCGTGLRGAAACAALFDRTWRDLADRLDRAVPCWRTAA